MCNELVCAFVSQVAELRLALTAANPSHLALFAQVGVAAAEKMRVAKDPYLPSFFLIARCAFLRFLYLCFRIFCGANEVSFRACTKTRPQANAPSGVFA